MWRQEEDQWDVGESVLSLPIETTRLHRQASNKELEQWKQQLQQRELLLITVEKPLPQIAIILSKLNLRKLNNSLG